MRIKNVQLYNSNKEKEKEIAQLKNQNFKEKFKNDLSRLYSLRDLRNLTPKGQFEFGHIIELKKSCYSYYRKWT